MASNGLVMSEAWSFAWQEHNSRVHVMSCHIRTLPPTPPPPPHLTDSCWQPPCFIKCWHSECHDTYLRSPLSSPAPECQGWFWGRLMSDIWLTVFIEREREAKDKNVEVQCGGWGWDELEEGRMSASSPPGGFHLQQQDLEAQLMPEVYLSQSHWCTYCLKGCAPQVLLKFMASDVFVGVTAPSPFYLAGAKCNELKSFDLFFHSLAIIHAFSLRRCNYLLILICSGVYVTIY